MEFIVKGDTSKLQESFTRVMFDITMERLERGEFFEPKKNKSTKKK